MPIVKITGQGLSAIACSVALLWGCWIEEQSLARRDHLERARLLHDLKVLQQSVPASQPVSAPFRRAPRTQRTTAG